MEKIHANLIIEIMGRPKENVESSMKGLVTRISSSKGVKVQDAKYHDAVPVEKVENLFTTFCEVFVEFDSIEEMLQIIMMYMPSNIEVIKPETLILTNSNLSALTNQLVQKLHNYDSIVKNSLMQREILANKLKEVAPHLFKKKGESGPDKPENIVSKKPVKRKKSKSIKN